MHKPDTFDNRHAIGMCPWTFWPILILFNIQNDYDGDDDKMYSL